jgi:bilin biosynthesis protein
MSERFDVLFEGMPEEKALMYLRADPEKLDNPVDKYMAATKLAACHSERSLDGLIEAVGLNPENLINRITRRKALEALGRRKDKKSLPHLFNALCFDDEPSVINAIDSIAQIGEPLTDEQCNQLIGAIDSSDAQKRCVIQAHTRLRLTTGRHRITALEQDENPLVSGAACAYAAQVFGEVEKLTQVVQQLTDPIAGRRRSAVIDLGDAGDASALQHLVSCPVSMPLRAKSAFHLADPKKTGVISEPHSLLLEQLLRDNPANLALQPDWICEPSVSTIEKNLQHRDEGKQYGGALSLIRMQKPQQIEAIEKIQAKYWSDYGANYLLTSIVGLERVHEHSDLIRTALAETLPQYTKSRVAAAWACLSLNLSDQTDLLREIQAESKWIPLRWSCERVLQQLS